MTLNDKQREELIALARVECDDIAVVSDNATIELTDDAGCWVSASVWLRVERRECGTALGFPHEPKCAAAGPVTIADCLTQSQRHDLRSEATPNSQALRDGQTLPTPDRPGGGRRQRDRSCRDPSRYCGVRGRGAGEAEAVLDLSVARVACESCENSR